MMMNLLVVAAMNIKIILMMKVFSNNNDEDEISRCEEGDDGKIDIHETKTYFIRQNGYCSLDIYLLFTITARVCIIIHARVTAYCLLVN